MFYSSVVFASLLRLIAVSPVGKNGGMSSGAEATVAVTRRPQNSLAPNAVALSKHGARCRRMSAIADVLRRRVERRLSSELLGDGAGKGCRRALAVRKRLRFTG
jgi:hypothetical protein